jgi:hypothetical protein
VRLHANRRNYSIPRQIGDVALEEADAVPDSFDQEGIAVFVATILLTIGPVIKIAGRLVVRNEVGERIVAANGTLITARAGFSINGKCDFQAGTPSGIAVAAFQRAQPWTGAQS